MLTTYFALASRMQYESVFAQLFDCVGLTRGLAWLHYLAPAAPRPLSLSLSTMKDINYACPGYESVLNELLSLAELIGTPAAPTGILLSGCAGVGKSRMVRGV